MKRARKKRKRLEELLKLFPIAVIFQCKLGPIVKSRGNNIRKCFPLIVAFFSFSASSSEGRFRPTRDEFCPSTHW